MRHARTQRNVGLPGIARHRCRVVRGRLICGMHRSTGSSGSGMPGSPRPSHPQAPGTSHPVTRCPAQGQLPPSRPSARTAAKCAPHADTVRLDEAATPGDSTRAPPIRSPTTPRSPRLPTPPPIRIESTPSPSTPSPSTPGPSVDPGGRTRVGRLSIGARGGRSVRGDPGTGDSTSPARSATGSAGGGRAAAAGGLAADAVRGGRGRPAGVPDGTEGGVRRGARGRDAASESAVGYPRSNPTPIPAQRRARIPEPKRSPPPPDSVRTGTGRRVRARTRHRKVDARPASVRRTMRPRPAHRRPRLARADGAPARAASPQSAAPAESPMSTAAPVESRAAKSPDPSAGIPAVALSAHPPASVDGRQRRRVLRVREAGRLQLVTDPPTHSSRTVTAPESPTSPGHVMTPPLAHPWPELRPAPTPVAAALPPDALARVIARDIRLAQEQATV